VTDPDTLTKEAANTPGLGRIFTPAGGSMSRSLPELAPKVFSVERDRAFDRRTPAGFIDLDSSDELDLDYPATTPLMLARYLILDPGVRFEHRLRASGEIYHVLQGAGVSRNAGETIAWSVGDFFTFPGGETTVHTADARVVLFLATNEPELSFGGFDPPPRARARTAAALYTTREVDDHLAGVLRQSEATVTAEYVNLTTEAQLSMRTVLPSMVAGVNTLEPGAAQRPHLHNAAAITLGLQTEGVYSLVGGQRLDWAPGLVMVTPPRMPHSHVNAGPRLMKSFVLQDGGLYHHCRNSGFEFVETAAP